MVLSGVISVIVLMNLLIAIISGSFEKINTQALQASYQEKARIIAENGYLISKRAIEAHCDKNSYLVVAKEVHSQENQEMEEVVESQISILEKILAAQVGLLELNKLHRVKSNASSNKQWRNNSEMSSWRLRSESFVFHLILYSITVYFNALD